MDPVRHLSKRVGAAVHLLACLAFACLSLSPTPARAATPANQADAFITIALPDVAGRPATLELATTGGKVTATYLMAAPPVALDGKALVLAAGRLTGAVQLPAGAVTLDAALADGKVTGTYTGAAKGTVSGSYRGKQAVLGSRDFYPSPDQPFGFRGDGNGAYPGATPVTEWWEGKPVQKSVKVPERGAWQTVQAWDIAPNTVKNIVWKTEMPGWGNTQPIVVGDKVFSLGEPDLLICTDVHTGKVLWSRVNNAWEIAGVEPKLAERLRDMAGIYQALNGIPEIPLRNPKAPAMPADAVRGVMSALGKDMPGVLAALKTLDPEGSYQEPAQTAIDAVATYLADPTADAMAIKGPVQALNGVIQKRIEALGKQKFPIVPYWGNMVGMNMCTPVSDGQYVYACLGQGQTVCYDLDGTRVWARLVQPNTDRTSRVCSPLLAGGVLVDMQGGAAALRGLDTRTGTTLWETPTKGETAVKGGGYYVASHKVMRLREGDRTEDVIVTTLCNIIRARDGKVMGALPFTSPASGGPSLITVADDIVVKGANGDQFSAPMTAFRLTLKGDTVTAEQLWDLGPASTPDYWTPAVVGKYLVTATRQGNVFDGETGKQVVTVDRRNKLGTVSNTTIGHLLVWADESRRLTGMTEWSRRRDDSRTFVFLHTADLSDPTKPKRLNDQCILGGDNLPRIPLMEKYTPALYASPHFWGDWGAKVAHCMYADSTICAQGNRIFVRTVSHLYCIGDPGVAYDWNPASAHQ